MIVRDNVAPGSVDRVTPTLAEYEPVAEGGEVTVSENVLLAPGAAVTLAGDALHDHPGTPPWPVNVDEPQLLSSVFVSVTEYVTAAPLTIDTLPAGVADSVGARLTQEPGNVTWTVAPPAPALVVRNVMPEASVNVWPGSSTESNAVVVGARSIW